MKTAYLILALAMAVLGGGVAFKSQSMPTIAIVRIPYVLEKSKAMKEASTRLEAQRKTMQAEIDSLAYAVRQEYLAIQEASQAGKTAAEIQVRQANLTFFEKSRAAKAAELNGLMETYTQGALNQVNAKVKEYAQEHDIDLILGGNYQGNILYGSEAFDVSDKIISYINE